MTRMPIFGHARGNFKIWPLIFSENFHGKILKNVRALAFWVSAFYTKTQIEIWPLLSIFRGFLKNYTFQHILSYKLHRTCNSMVQIEWCWFYLKIFIFGQVMAKNVAHAHIWAYIFWLIGLKVFMGTQETIIYRLVVRNLSYDAYFSVLIFWGKMGVATTRPHAPLIFWGLQTQSKSWPTGWTFWANRYLKIMFSKFSGVNPPE